MAARCMFRLPVLCLLLAAGLSPAFGQKSAAASIVPERFLRGYDPVTVSFPAAVGPSRGGPADGPGDYLKITPAVPGEYRWLDGRTIQFLPAVAWPALKKYTVQAGETSVTLFTMMVPPVSITPSAGSTDLEPIASFTLDFRTDLDTEALARMVSIDVRDLPGVSSDGALVLSGSDLSVRALKDRLSLFQVSPKNPIPYGKKATIRLRLSLDDSVPDSIARYSFSTKPEFTMVAMGAGSVRLPITSAGAVYSREQAVNCGTENAPLFLEFSEAIAPVSMETVKRLVSFEPAVRNLAVSLEGKRLLLRFQSDRDKPYRVSFSHQPLASASGRILGRFSKASFHFYYVQATPYITWRAAAGIAERYGPQSIPMEGRGMGRMDLRVYKVNPESLEFWPFPSQPVSVDETRRPPMSGEEQDAVGDIVSRIQLLGSPDISRLIDLPISEQSGRSTFGIDLRGLLAERFGADAPGTYLVGYRCLDSSTQRFYVRLAVTDLSLSTVEEEDAVNFIVTSLRTGAPIAGAAIRVEGNVTDAGGTSLKPLFTGRTDQTGQFRYRHAAALPASPLRIVVQKDADVLILDPRSPPPSFANNHWSQGSAAWLEWLASPPRVVRHERYTRAYILTERPVYRPEEPVHILGWVRDRQDGKILRTGDAKGFTLIVAGPGGKEWKYPADLNGNGRFYHEFKERDLPTGEFAAVLQSKATGSTLATVGFRKESYRVPTFEVSLTGPDKVPMDKPFELVLTADYYAGGRVVGERVDWEVTRTPYSISNPSYPGFIFSTDERFSGGVGYDAVGVLSQQTELDEEGSARVKIDPAAEGDARARRYTVRATVQGADRQTVTTAKSVYALPAFSIGIKLDRFVTGAMEISPQIIVLDHLEDPLPGKRLTVRLLQRQWHSYIAETDFTTGEARYVTDVVDAKVSETSLTSGETVLTPAFPVREAGVYVVEVSGRDQLGRQIMVKADLFVAGSTPVTWERKKASVFEITLDKAGYQPGMTAQLLLKSPYQDGHALVAVEGPESNAYSWVRISNGQGVLTLPITAAMAPGVPVSVLLERGRVEGTGADTARLDLGKPSSLGASTWIVVQPVANQVKVSLDHPVKAQPGTTLPIRISIRDWKGAPLDGEVALWLVDRAVLSLGTEQPLTPLTPFTEKSPSALRLRDSRNLVFGNLPVEEAAGGDGAMDFDLLKDLLERTTVRKNFKTVPYFNPAIQVSNGEAEITVELPDNLTDFAVRAVAVSGYDRFGVARSAVSVRLPVVAQSVLPRFVRPSDSFAAGGLARIAEGPDGPGLAGITVEGLQLDGADPGTGSRRFTFEGSKARKLLFPMRAPETLREGGPDVAVSLFVERVSDKVRDAFRIALPVRWDSEKRRETKTVVTDGTQAVALPNPAEPARQGTLERRIVVAKDPRLLTLVQGLTYLGGYAHGCVEQRISKLSPALFLKDLLESTGLLKAYPANTAVFQETFTYMASCIDEDGLYGFWPGSAGTVSLTAYVVEFLAACKAAGFTFDQKLLDRPVAALSRALRSDYKRLLSGWTSYERVEALAALDAAGKFDEGYANDLLANAASLPLYSQARLYICLKNRRLAGSRKATDLGKAIAQSIVTKKESGREIFAGLRGGPAGTWGGLVLSSELKTVAAVAQALLLVDPKSNRLAMISDYLVSLSGPAGWGSTQDNVAGMRAVKALLANTAARGGEVSLELKSAKGTRRLSTGGMGLAAFPVEETGPVSVTVRKGASADQPVSLFLSVDYMPAARGTLTKASNNGFAVERELITIGAEGGATGHHRAVSGVAVELALDTVVEEHVRVVNFADRNFVAVIVPIAAGLEPLNPNLAGAPPEATPSGGLTLAPTYALYGDDAVTFYYNTLPKGNYDFSFRVRASFSGSFTEPAARAELLYNLDVRGRSDGCALSILPEKE